MSRYIKKKTVDAVRNKEIEPKTKHKGRHYQTNMSRVDVQEYLNTIIITTDRGVEVVTDLELE